MISPFLIVGRSTLLTYAQKTSPVVAPPIVIHAVVPSRRTVEIMVIIRQRLQGAALWRRLPRGQRPRVQVMFVFLLTHPERQAVTGRDLLGGISIFADHASHLRDPAH